MRNFKKSTWKPNSSKTLCFLTKLVEIYISEFFVDFQPISTKAQFLKIYKKNLTFPTHFRKLAEGIFLLISISKCFFLVLFFRKFVQFFQSRQKKCNFWEILKCRLWNRIFRKSWSGTIKTLCFLIKLIEIYISEFFVDFLSISIKAQFLENPYNIFDFSQVHSRLWNKMWHVHFFIRSTSTVRWYCQIIYPVRK